MSNYRVIPAYEPKGEGQGFVAAAEALATWYFVCDGTFQKKIAGFETRTEAEKYMRDELDTVEGPAQSETLFPEYREGVSMTDKKHIVVIVDIVNGCTFLGPFDSFDDALAWAERKIGSN